MGDEWHRVPLDDLVEEIVDRRGITPLKLGSKFKSEGFRVVSAKAIKNRRVDLSADEPRFVDEATYRRWMRTPLHADDVILTSEAPLGEPAYLRQAVEWCLGQRLFGIRTLKSRLLGRYLFYALQFEEVRHDLLSRATGTTAQGIRQSELRRVSIPLPELNEQEAIAELLGALDDKIELNRRMNETLEGIARAIFKSWFVDFDPVRAKAEGRDPGLPKRLADLFPDRLVDSEISRIPEGWRVGCVGDMAEQTKEKVDPRDAPGALFQHFSIPAFDAGRQPRLELGEGIRSVKSRVRPGAILLSKLNPEIERVWLVDVDEENEAICSTELVVLHARPPLTRSYLYYAMREQAFRRQLEGLVTGTSKSHQRAHVKAVFELPCVVPPAALPQAFDETVSSILDRTLACRREQVTLSGNRDTLLPKLVSGEIRLDGVKAEDG